MDCRCAEALESNLVAMIEGIVATTPNPSRENICIIMMKGADSIFNQAPGLIRTRTSAMMNSSSVVQSFFMSDRELERVIVTLCPFTCACAASVWT
jgi:hypothetical protein